MSFVRSIIMAFACFSAIPMPHIDWDDAGQRHMLAAFPLVGVVIGACVWLWGTFAAQLGLGAALHGAGITLVPVLLTGGIHLDGFADTVDALGSHASPERKREIMKDPHVGAFAIMGICCYLLAYFSLACEVTAGDLLPVACIPVASRCLSAFATVSFPAAKREGMLAHEQTSANPAVVRAVASGIFVAVAVAMIAHSPAVGAAAALSGLATLGLVRRLALREFGGMSGDLAGYLLQMSELAMLACVVLVGRLV